MLTKVWEKIGEGLAERWLLTIFTPAFVFWAGGAIAYVQEYGLDPLMQKWLGITVIEKGALLLGAVGGISVSAALIQMIQDPVLRLLEGYWPRWFAKWRFNRATQWADRLVAKTSRWQELQHAVSAHDLAERRQLDAEIARIALPRERIMPTLIGNLLRSAEDYPGLRYGLDAIVCWPRLFLLLPPGTQQEISAARERLGTQTRLFVWSLLFLVWTWWQWWALGAVGVMIMAYYGIITAAAVYGDILRAAFDVHRFSLYRSLAWPLPTHPAREQEIGRELTQYLFRGSVAENLAFAFVEEHQNTKATPHPHLLEESRHL